MYSLWSSPDVHVPAEQRIVRCSQEDRQRHLASVCKKLSPKMAHEAQRLKYLRSKEHGVLYCSNHKSASSTWRKVMAMSTSRGRHQTSNFNPHNEKELKLRDIEQLAYDPQLAARDKYFSFFVSRHPVERMLSFFRTLIEQRIPKELLGTSEISYAESARQYLYERLPMSKDINMKHFIVLALRANDRYWFPQYRLCNPCNHK